jgi:hypothetical protein
VVAEELSEQDVDVVLMIFPEEYGYCDNCFPSSEIYSDKLMILRAIKDRADETMLKLLTEFLIEFDHEFESIYIQELKG